MPSTLETLILIICFLAALLFVLFHSLHDYCMTDIHGRRLWFACAMLQLICIILILATYFWVADVRLR